MDLAVVEILVDAVTLGGSRATGEATPDPDWNFGLSYRDTIDVLDHPDPPWLR